MNENQNDHVDINAHDNYPDSEQTIEIPTMKVIPLKKICMTIGELPTAYIETMTYYEMLLWFIGYLRDNIIPVVNGNGEAVQELQNVVMSLQNYINEFKDSIDEDVENLEEYMNNYFENLDVQDEINNKLDKMLDDGVLTTIIQQFLQSTAIWAFDTVADMQSATNLTNGSYAKTLGYYAVNDGGGATYKITNSTSNLYHQETLTGGLYANLIVDNNTINFRQLGATPCIYPDVTNKTDSKNYLLEYETLCANNNMQYKLFIPNGLWFFTETLITRHLGVNIVGETNFSRSDYSGTIILPYQDNQAYIWKIGGVADYSNKSAIPVAQMVTQTNLDNLTFSTGTFIEALKYKVSVGCLILDRVDFSTIPNLNIMHFNGNGLVVRTSWEITIGNLMFRNHSGFGTNQMLWDDSSSVTGVSPNISAFDINYLMSEGCDGPLLYSAPISGASHNHIGHINIENAFSSGTKSTLTEADAEYIDTYIPIDLITGFFRSLMIDSINFFDNNAQKTTDEEENVYYFRSLFADIEHATSDYYSRFNVVVGELSARIISAYEYLVHSVNSYTYNKLTIGSLNSLDNFKEMIFDMKFGMRISIGNNVPERLPCLMHSPNDAINFVGNGRNPSSIRPSTDKNVLYSDIKAPSYGKLVAYTEGGTNEIALRNSFGSSIKCRILYRTISDNAGTIFAFRCKYNDSNTSTNTNITASTDNYVWSNWSNSINADMNEIITMSTLGNAVAKIEIREAS